MASLQQLDGSTLLLFLLFVVSCFVFARGRFRPAGRKGDRPQEEPPSPRPLPIIGNLHELVGRHHPHRRLQLLARRHGPLFFLRLGSAAPTLVVSSAAMAEAVLRTQDHVFCSRPQQRTARGTLYDSRDVGFSPYGDRWRQLRRIAVVHLLSAKRVDSFRGLRADELSSFLQRLRSAASSQEEKHGGIDVTELIVSLTYGVISRAAFGDKLGGVEPGAVREIMAELTDLLGTIAVSDVFPRFGWVVDWATGLDARVKRTAAKLDDILERAFEEHERSRGGNAGGGEAEAAAPDLLDDLLSIVRDGDQGVKLDMVDAKGLILDMFIAGTDTTYKTVEWTMAELVKNPREMEKVQAEVRQVVGAGEKQQGSSVVVVQEEDLEKMSLLKAAMKEALRLHPPVPLLIPRETIQDTRLHGYHIPARTRVMVNAWAIGRDGEAWGEDAEEFRPERFLVHGPAAMVDYSGKDTRFIPFGAGRRGCPGVAFGTRLAELTLANMMCHFDWALPAGRDLESFEVVESTGLSPGLKHPLTLAVTPV